MKLSFLGQSYETSIHAVDAVETSETATFLGKPYHRKQYTVNQRHQPSTEMTYRGVRYTA
ncbi:DUF4278 domain-containing protein [Leptolyngbya iicbica]|uniref:DUF4278 domain-containing protein n=2 Tax=Cyanophyceae TaxID=3028117 RepID=A0A4Q7EI33_9CYAN|nr:DUF4278 domain-containing protein [Leptolyngbya sp. LK]RZM82756.1 DUF4278 domain-containing protein [Leptolyngbya sp. LK]